MRKCLPSGATVPLLQIKNIPNNFGVADLRRFFAHSIEQRGFRWFDRALNSEKATARELIVECSSSTAMQQIFERYSGAQWIDRQGRFFQSRCELHRVEDGAALFGASSVTSPSLPRGNVGSTESEVIDAIGRCLIPHSVLKQLGLRSDASQRRRQFRRVAMDYDTKLLRAVPKAETTAEVGFEEKNTAREEEEPEEWDREASIRGDGTEMRYERTDRLRCEEYLYEEPIQDAPGRTGPSYLNL